MTSLVLAIVASFAYGVAMVMQGVGVDRSDGRPKPFGRLSPAFRHPAFLAGLFLDLAAWVLSRVALHRLAIFVVQSILAGSLAVTVIGGEIFFNAPVHRRDHVAIALSLVGLVFVGLSAGPQTIETLPRFYEFSLLLALPVIMGIGLMSVRLMHPAVGGVLGGMALGGSSLAARTIHVGRLMGLMSDPLAWAVVAYSVIGLVLVTRALEHGRVGPVAATMWTAEIVPATVIGSVVLGDRARAGYGAFAVAGVCITIAATVVLALSPAGEVEPTV